MYKCYMYILLYVFFIKHSLFSMQVESRNDIAEKAPFNVLVRICEMGSDFPWQALSRVYSLKLVCKRWKEQLKNLKAIASLLNIPLMHCAAAMGNVDEIINLKLKKRYSLLEPDKRGFSPSDYAFKMNQTEKQRESIKILQMAYGTKDDQELKIDDSINYTIKDFCTALQNDNIEQVEIMLLQDMDKVSGLLIDLAGIRQEEESFFISERCEKRIIYTMQGLLECTAFTDLHDNVFFQYWDEDLCELMLLYDANINAYDAEGWTLLHRACEDPQKYKSLEVLLSLRGINVNCTSRNIHRDHQQEITPLCTAINTGNTWAMKALLATGACKVNLPDKNGKAALHYAAISDNVTAAKLLVEHNADMYQYTTSHGGTPIHYAARYNAINTLKYFCDLPRCEINTKSDLGKTPLTYAVQFGENSICIKYLLEKKANINVKTTGGSSLLHIAVAFNQGHLLPVLIPLMEGSINSINHDGQTPLHTATSHGGVQCVQQLLDARAAINRRDNRGDTPLHHAAMYGNCSAISVLCLYRARMDCNHSNCSCCNFTPLHYAAYCGYLCAVKKLVHHNSDINKQTKEGLAAYDFAKHGGHQDIVNFLLMQKKK